MWSDVNLLCLKGVMILYKQDPEEHMKESKSKFIGIASVFSSRSQSNESSVSTAFRSSTTDDVTVNWPKSHNSNSKGSFRTMEGWLPQHRGIHGCHVSM